MLEKNKNNNKNNNILRLGGGGILCIKYVSPLSIKGEKVIVLDQVQLPYFMAIKTISNIRVCEIPIGAILESFTDLDPSITYPGTTWERIKGRVIVGVDEGVSYYNVLNKTGGTNSTKHAFYLPPINSAISQDAPQAYMNKVIDWCKGQVNQTATAGLSRQVAIQNIGGNIRAGSGIATEVSYATYQSSNMQPYITVYMWKRLS